MEFLSLSEIQIAPARLQNGLVAFASCVINNQFYVGNIAIYTSPATRDGFRLVFPNKKLSSGRVVDCFYPISKEAADIVTSAVVKKYVELMNNFHHVDAV